MFWHDTTVNGTSIPLLVLAFLFLRQADFPPFGRGRAELGSLPLGCSCGSRYCCAGWGQEAPGKQLCWFGLMCSYTVEPLPMPSYCTNPEGLSPIPHLQSCLQIRSWSKPNSPSSLAICFKSCSLAPSSVWLVGFGIGFLCLFILPYRGEILLNFTYYSIVLKSR